jgi:tRNA(Ile)-lysidine synthase
MLAARWRSALAKGPKLLAVTIDHALRPESAAEARAVKRLARSLGVPHRTVRWEGKKPASGLQQAAREARYRLLAAAARKAKARCILTAHTLDDQAETVLIRMSRGSGLTGLGAMARVAPVPATEFSGEVGLRFATQVGLGRLGRDHAPISGKPEIGENASTQQSRARLRTRSSSEREIVLVRPLLDIPKARLVATLDRARIAAADDPSNRDPRFTRARLRDVMPVLAREGLDARSLALLARRLRRAEAAIEMAVGVAAAALSEGPWPDRGPIGFDAEKFARLPAEVALRLLGRVIAHTGDEGSVQLGKLEALHSALDVAFGSAKAGESTGLRRTLAGALVTLTATRLVVDRAPARAAVRSALTTGKYDGRGAPKRR